MGSSSSTTSVGGAAANVSLTPDYRLKWLGNSGNNVRAIRQRRLERLGGARRAHGARRDGHFAADIFLPARCPRKNLIMAGVCCYRYKFYLETGSRRRWLHDPRQPLDKDPDGWVNNFMCKYAHTHDGSPLRMLPRASFTKPHSAGASGASSERSGNVRWESAPPPPPALEVCLVLPATYLNGTKLSAMSTRGPGMCCEACRRQRGCHAYNWRPEPLARNCVLFGRDYGTPRGTALSSAGLVKVPLRQSTTTGISAWSPPPPPSPGLAASRGKPTRVRSRKSKGKHKSKRSQSSV